LQSTVGRPAAAAAMWQACCNCCNWLMGLLLRLVQQGTCVPCGLCAILTCAGCGTRACSSTWQLQNQSWLGVVGSWQRHAGGPSVGWVDFMRAAALLHCVPAGRALPVVSNGGAAGAGHLVVWRRTPAPQLRTLSTALCHALEDLVCCFTIALLLWLPCYLVPMPFGCTWQPCLGVCWHLVIREGAWVLTWQGPLVAE
jgi:hypothetical protein